MRHTFTKWTTRWSSLLKEKAPPHKMDYYTSTSNLRLSLFKNNMLNILFSIYCTEVIL